MIISANKADTLLKDEQAHPLILFIIMTQLFDVDWLTWTPSVLRKSIERTRSINPAKINIHKAMASAAVAKQESFWTEWEHFHFLTQALNNNVPDPQTHHPLTVAQMLSAATIAAEIRKSLKELTYVPEFSEEVLRYIAAQALNQNIWFLPAPLDAANKYTSGLRYKCNDCGNDDELVFDDKLCSVCIDRFNTESLGAWEPDAQLIAKGRGKNTTIYERNPISKVKARLEQWRLRPTSITLGENRVDVCVARLIVALNYVNYRNSQLGEQLVK